MKGILFFYARLINNKTLLDNEKMQYLVTLSTKNIEFIQDHLDELDSSIALTELTFSLANLVSSLGENDGSAHHLYKAAAKLGHGVAQHIVGSFKDDAQSVQPISNQETQNISSESNANVTEQEQLRAMRLRFFAHAQKANKGVRFDLLTYSTTLEGLNLAN